MMRVDGSRLRRLREDAGIDSADLANRAQVSRQYLWYLETGQRDNPTPSVVARLAQALGVAIVDLRAES